MVLAGLGWLANTDVTAMPMPVRAECLRRLEQARSVETAAHAAVLSAFDLDCGFTADAQCTSRTWLRWQTQITTGAAAGAVGWMRRLRAHPAVARALASAKISASWAKEICALAETLPREAWDDADKILLAAAAGGAGLDDLASLAEQMLRKLARPDQDRDDGFEERRLTLATTLGGAGTLAGDLTSACAAALQAVLDALGKKAGPEDKRTQRQRHHDALEEACRRLIAAGNLPDRAGQPTQIQLHISLEELTRRLTNPGGAVGGPQGAGVDALSRIWPRIKPDGSTAPEPLLPGPTAPPGYECDATIIPIVTGRIDHDLLDKLVATLAQPGCDKITVRDLIAANAVALLSGPGGLASFLRTGTLPRPAASISLPLDVGAATDTIPAYLRRLVILRDRHCQTPGCQQPASASQVHHLIPRSKGGRTCLGNLGLYCPFHHLIVIHQWGWTVTRNADGTTTMRSPDGSREYHSHSPPPATAA